MPPKKSAPSKNTMVIIGAVAVLVVIAGIYFVVLPKLSAITGSGDGVSGSVTQAPLVTMTASPTTLLPTPTTVPTPTPDPFPNALSLKQWFTFGEGKVESQGAVYKFWMNDTYEWHNDMDAKWYTQKPKTGNKYLFIFVNIVNRGTARVWYPKAGSIVVHYNGMKYLADPMHYIPDKSGGNLKATPVEVRELQYYSKLSGAEFVEDYGLSHGTMSDYVYPGESNAIDGYIIYEVPKSLTADKTYVEIAFNGEDQAVWKLA
jgi:hypothetical protein